MTSYQQPDNSQQPLPNAEGFLDLSAAHSIDVQVVDLFAERIDQTLVKQVIGAVLAQEGVAQLVEISVLITDDAALQQLNRDYRGVDAPTDVLSFADDPQSAFVPAPGSLRYLGDIALSYERVLAQADDYGHSPQRELAYLVAHGMLHLLGYDHECGDAEAAAMRSREEMVMTYLGLGQSR